MGLPSQIEAGQGGMMSWPSQGGMMSSPNQGGPDPSSLMSWSTENAPGQSSSAASWPAEGAWDPSAAQPSDASFGKAANPGKGVTLPGSASPYSQGGKGCKGFVPKKLNLDHIGIQTVIDGLIKEGLPGAYWENRREVQNALYLNNLPPDTTDMDLYTIFASFGPVCPRGVKVMPGVPGHYRFGFINYMDAATAEFAVNAMNGVIMPDGAALVVKLKRQKGQATNPAPSPLAIATAAAAAPVPVDPAMLARLKAKLAQAPMGAYDLSQWYIIEHLSEIKDEGEMKRVCDMLLAACAQLGLT